MPSRRDWKAFGLGFGAAMIVGSVLPNMRNGLRPAAKGVVRGLVVAQEKVKTISAELQEEIEDAMAEVHFERAQENLPAESYDQEEYSTHE